MGYHVIGPAVEDGAIVLGELSSAAELPFGWGVARAGRVPAAPRDDTAAFGHSAGPQSWKRSCIRRASGCGRQRGTTTD